MENYERTIQFVEINKKKKNQRPFFMTYFDEKTSKMVVLLQILLNED